MSTLKATYLQQASSASPNITLDAFGNALVNNATLSPTGSSTNTGNIALTGTVAMGSSFKRNRIINGDMRVDQRNAGASGNLAAATIYTVDRWATYASQASKATFQQNAGSVATPTGFSNYIGITVGASANVSLAAGDIFQLYQVIEGYNIADFDWGKATAKNVTISFWVRSSLTGTFSGSIYMSGVSSYVFEYSISQANTWEYKTVSITANTSYSPSSTTTGSGCVVSFDLGAGSTYTGSAGSWTGSIKTKSTSSVSVITTNSATFYITGVQLEVGSVATPYERQIYSDQLAQCQRYYYRQTPAATTALYGQGLNDSTTAANGFVAFPVPMRTAPTALEQSGTATHYRVQITGNVINCSAVPTFNSADTWFSSVVFTVASGLTAGQASLIRAGSTSGYLGWSAEL
jgi:hypothetical protein